MVRYNVWVIFVLAATMLGCGEPTPPAAVDVGPVDPPVVETPATAVTTPTSELKKLDAEVVLKQALAQAAGANKNVLVHLGAPW